MRIRGIYIHDVYTGFCNQWIQFFHGVIRCICDGVDVIVVDDFQTDLYSHTTRPLHEVLDLVTFNRHLSQQYGVVVVSKDQLDIRVRRVLYGTMTSFLDLTAEFVQAFVRDHHLVVPPGAPLNTLRGDPAFLRRKSLRVAYQITPDLDLERHYAEEHCGIDCHFTDIPYHRYEHWPKQIPWMETLLRSCPFHPSFYRDPSPGRTVHVVHARLEPDSVRHWARENHMPEDAFHDLLADKYIQSISRHMDDGGVILVLSYEKDNRVVDHLAKTGRPYLFLEKEKDNGREWNAVRDMAFAETCGNGVFLGNFDLYRMQGSTYSYFLMKKCRFQTCVLVDIERIQEDPLVLHTP
jgi:hypothetical protein